MISPQLLSRVHSVLARGEAVYFWMYLDSAGFVTTGCGKLLATAADAKKLPFYHEGTQAAATPAEIEAGWNKICAGSAEQKAAPNNKKHTAKYYKPMTDLRITKAVSDRLMDEHLANDERYLKILYPGFDSFPDDAKVALFDMMYNLSLKKLRLYVNFNAAVNSGNWLEASKQCSRKGISTTRNIDTAALFANCASKRPNAPAGGAARRVA